MTETNSELWNRLVNSKWPDAVPIPEPAEAVSGATRLYRKAMGKPWRGRVKLVSGNRYTWIERRVLYVNPNQTGWGHRGGWRSIVHSIAHLAHGKLHPGDRPHSHRELYIERDLVDHVLAQGWLDGRLKPKTKPPRDVIKERYSRIVARENSWQTKSTRATKALAKVRRERRAYEARHGDRVRVAR